MLSLYITRHAKSSWSDAGMPDFERPLNERGMRNAPFMAKCFSEREEPLDLIISSTAVRAISTALIFAKEMDMAASSVNRMSSLYHSTVPNLVDALHNLPDSAKRVMLFGHNPGLTELVEHLCGEDIGNLSTCGTVRIDMHVDEWKLVSRDLGTLIWMDYPKQHEGQG